MSLASLRSLSRPAFRFAQISPTIVRMSSTSQQPLGLVSVNTAPERAKKVIGEVIENVKDRYNLVHAGNSETIEGVVPLLKSIQPPPAILFCASMWTPEQQEHIQAIAKETIPGIKTYGIPTGLQVKVGPQGIVEHLMERIDEIMQQK